MSRYTETRQIISEMQPEDVSLLFIRGFLRGWQEVDAATVESFLDQAVLDPVWGRWFPELQCSVGLEGAGANRLFKALSAGIAPTWQYRYISSGGVSVALAPAVIEALALSLSETPDGGSAAIDLLGMVVFSAKERGDNFSADIAHRIAGFLARIDLSRCNVDDTMVDHHLGRLISFALINISSGTLDNEILANLISWERSNRSKSFFKRGRYLRPFFALRPILTLDAVYQPDPDGSYRGAIRLAAGYDNERGARPMEAMPLDAALEWCSTSPEDRCLFIAATCELYAPQKNGEEEGERRLSEIANAVFKMAPRKKDLLQTYANRLMPMSWTRSRADKLRRRLGIFGDLASMPSKDDAQMVADERQRMLKVVSEMKEQEEAEERTRNETFE